MSVKRAVLLASAMLGLGGQPARAQDYRLGPQDQVQIRVFDLRAGNGQSYQWPAFDGPFSVNAAGKLSLPLIGEVDAEGRTTGDLAATVAGMLQEKVGLAERPDAAVQVVKYRPFYVIGSVEKSGAFEYQPDMTVLQAVGMAGGPSHLGRDALLGFERDALSSRGDVRLLGVDRLALLIRQARLAAEIDNVSAIDIPVDLKAHVDEPDVARMVREERMLFEARAYALSSQTAALEQTKVLLGRQIDSLNAKDASLARQLDIIKAELDQVTGLVSKGLAVLPRQLAIQQNTAQFESDRLDVQLAILRAQQDLSKADRDILELGNTRRNQALQEATEVRNRLAETDEKLTTAQRLVLQAEVRAPMALAAEAGASARPIYSIVRRSGAGAQTRPAQESDLVQPGDVVRVEPGLSTAFPTADAGRPRPAPQTIN